jgi:hypothetical protein
VWWEYNREYSKLFFELETPKIEKPDKFPTMRYTEGCYGSESVF